MALEFTFVPPIHISGIEPESVIVGNKFEMSGSGLCFATSGAFKSPYDTNAEVVPFTIETGVGYNGSFCVLTGTTPDVTPNDRDWETYYQQ